jgi:DNA-binding beta-propeller fold protein YncE
LRFPVLAYLGYWSVMAFAAFSIAGEKMPWLTTHIVLPFIPVSGWAIGAFIDQIDWKHFRERRAWLVALLLPITALAAFTAVGTLLGANPPLQGTELPELQATTAFVSAVIVAVIGGVGLYRLGEPLGWGNVARLAVLTVFGVLSLLTIRTAFVASYINYDYANEYLVYAHGARGVKTVMEQVEDISARTTDGLGLKVAYDAEVSWPVTWYMRNFKNQSYYAKQPTREALDAPIVIAGADWPRIESLLGDRYYTFEYIRMVWPMQDYFYMTLNSLGNGLILAPQICHETPLVGENIPEECKPFQGGLWSNGQYRQALWNIWFNRDYTLYGQLRNKSYDLAQWDPADRMRMYVRKDIAAQIWQYGVGPTEFASEVQKDPYADSRQSLTATSIIGGLGQGEGQFDGPRGVAVAPDGSVYVADSRNHRVQKFTASGQLVKAWGGLGKIDDNTAAPGTFNEPWGVGVAPDGSVYVADTWNHRIQKFDADGNFITMWGHWGQGETLDALYGPRAVAVDAEGRVYVADTGNKRIVVFDRDGQSLTAIGTGGFEPGFLDEPVGVAVSGEGLVYVADTWNQRLQIFRRDSATEDYLFDREVTLSAWYGSGGNPQSLDNKPYLALDSVGRVYVTDPEGYRVLVFDPVGQFLTTWGDYGSDASTFGTLSGVAVDAEGQVYVVDAGNSRVMRFAPLAP